MIKGILVDALRREVLADGFKKIFADYGGEVAGLGAFKDVSALVSTLDGLPPFSGKRDPLTADLLRLYQRCPVGPVLNAVLYSMSPRITRLIESRVRAGGDRGVLVSDLYDAMSSCAKDYDLDRASKYVQACLLLDVRRSIGVALRRESRLQAIVNIAGPVVGEASMTLATGDPALVGSLLRQPDSAAGADGRNGAGAKLLRALVDEKLLSSRDAALFARVYFQDVPLSEAARELGLRADAARKARSRALKCLREHCSVAQSEGEAPAPRIRAARPPVVGDTTSSSKSK